MTPRMVARVVVEDGRTSDGREPVHVARTVAPERTVLLQFRDLLPDRVAAALSTAAKVAAVRPAGIAVLGSFRQVADFETLLRRPQDRLVLGDTALTDPSLVDYCAQGFGTARVVVQVAWRTGLAGDPEVFADAGRSPTGRGVVAWCRQVERRGAGEILLEDAAAEGVSPGSSALIQAVTAAVKLPVLVACGLPHPELIAAGAAGVVADA